jgi:DNA-binding MarR family transcriptional regulator
VARETYVELVDQLLETSGVLVGIAVRAVSAAPVEVTVAQHRVLLLLTRRGPQSVGDIAEHLGVNPSNASRQCDRLERLGLVERVRSTEDARVVLIELTAAGVAVLGEITRRRREEIARIVDRIPERDAYALLAAARKFNASAQEDRPTRDQR